MNKRIRRLMEQAVISIDGQTFGKTYVPDAFTEKFAELIVGECIGVAVDNGCGDFVDIKHLLLKHFGVEE